MGFEKKISYDIVSYETYETSSEEGLRKVASANVDLPEGFVYDPDYLYLLIRIVSAGESYGPNKNGDYFPEEELIQSYQTFNEANVFKNHENKMIEKAIGKIFSIRWNPFMRCVELFKGIDKKIAPEIARGYLKGYMTDVSMGCKVPYTICSVCGNKARRASEFCLHIRNHRMEFLGNGERVFEVNFEPKFHDSSVVLNGADRVSKALFVMDEPTGIDGEVLVKSFKKAATSITLCDAELNKVAEHLKTVHPLLQTKTLEKVASDNEFMRKIAELEKELTGKVMNVITSPNEIKSCAEPLLQIIKFLTEKRMDEVTLNQIAENLIVISDMKKLSISKVFTSFLAVAEMMGIELFPTELHILLTKLTNAKVENSLTLSDVDVMDAYPSDFAAGVKRVSEKITELPELTSPDELFTIYDEVPFQQKMPLQDFFANVQSSTENTLEEKMPLHLIRSLKDILVPIQPLRSRESEFLLPRLAVVLNGHKQLIGDNAVARDIEIMKNPKTAGDVLASLVYGNYSRMRPTFTKTVLIKTAMQHEEQLEKMAKDKPYGGIKRRTLLMSAVPLVYGASMFQKSRKEAGKNLSDAENFLATRPDVISAGIVLGGKPLSRAIGQNVVKAKNTVADGADKILDITKDGFNKLTSADYLGLMKVADSLEVGNFNVFNNEMLLKFASEYNLDGEYAAALKIATLCEIGGEEKIAQALDKHYNLGNYEKAKFLKFASDEARVELAKAANDFSDMLLFDLVTNAKQGLTTSLPGRVMDSLILTQAPKLLSKTNGQVV